MIHIWHEDSKDSVTTKFWKFLKDNNVSSDFKNADIQGFGSNDKVVEALKQAVIDNQDTYYIFIDYVRDNKRALGYYLVAMNYIKVKGYTNVHLMKLLSFEYLILGFKYFEQWTEPTKNNLLYNICKPVRKELIRIVDSQNASWINNETIVNYLAYIKGIDISDSKFVEQLQYISFENIATSLLSNMTNGGTTEFGITKTNFGKCWHCNCCGKYKDDVGDDKCRIYKDNKTANMKAVDLWNYTEAHCYITNWG
jgi:hypothetical protein